MRFALPLCLALTFVLVGVGCGADEPSEPGDPAAAWSATIAYEAGTKLGGCDVGDLDPAHPGNEIAAVAGDGRIFLVHHADGTWHGKTIAKAKGEMIQCAIGDADPKRPGNELVVVGMAVGTEDDGGKGAVHLVYHEEGAWKTEPVFEDTGLVHGVCIADVDTVHEGNEIVIVGFSKRATVLAKVHGGWVELGDMPLPGNGKAVCAIRGLLMAANTSNTLAAYVPRIETKILPEGDSEIESKSTVWPKTLEDVELFPMGISQARLGVGAKNVVAACDDGGLRLVTPDGVFTLHKETLKLRGAVLADLDPLVKEEEAATAGYGKTMTLLYRGDDWRKPWTAVTLWRDTEKFHHLAAGELWDKGLGLEIVGVGYSGRVIVAARTKR